jgi:hypothetical protein
MSGVLERMAQRALGALPTVQPLSAPHFAPADRGSYEKPLAPNSHHDQLEHLEVDAPPSRAEPARTRVRQAAGHWERPDQEHGTTSQRVAVLPTPAGEKPPARIDDRELQEPIQPFKRIAEARVADLKTISMPNPVTKALISQKPTPHGQQVGGELHGQPTLRKPAAPIIASEQFAHEMPVHLSDLPEENRTRTLPPKQPEDLVPDSHTASPVTNRIQQTVGTSHRDRRGAVVLPSSAEQKAEIHISIGRIELRAPRPETNPPATPFRPRVTLEEFLRRKPEVSG